MNKYVKAANQYIADVLSGKIDACLFIRQACQRQVDDLAKKEWRYHFDEVKARKVCAFIELLPHVDGEWAARGELLRLEPWQCFLLTTLFGWVDGRGKRRFRQLYSEIPRKNAKSTLLAAIGLYMEIADGERGAQVLCGATSMEQADKVFGPARQMMLGLTDLASEVGMTINKQSLVIENTNSSFKPVIGKTKDGDSPHCGIVDEYHQHLDSTQFNAFNTGRGARSQPLVAVITTAGDNLAGPCYSHRNHCTKILSGDIKNDRLFILIYTIDDDDEWTDFDVWKKANPNYGISVYPDFLEEQYDDAMCNARQQNALKTKHLNIWCGTTNAWLNMVAWDACKDETLKIEDFTFDECWIGVDLASKTDIASVVYLFERDKEFYLFVDKYLPEDTIMKTENEHYREWLKKGLIKQTDGAATDFDYIEDDIINAGTIYRVEELCYDSWKASHLEQHLTKRGLTCIEIRQGTATMSEPMKSLEALILQGKIHHDGDAVMRWMMGNVVAHEDVKGNIFPRKDHPANKIDGAVALINACVRALIDTEEPSIYETGACF